MATTLATITVPTSTAQVKLELQGISGGITALGPNDVPAPLLYYMQPIAPPPGQPVVAEGFILGNDLITLNGISGLTYYLVTVFDPVEDNTIYSEAFYFISGQTADLDTQLSISEGDLPTEPIFAQIVTAPTTTSSTGTPNQVAFDSNYFYVCVAINSWARIALDFSF